MPTHRFREQVPVSSSLVSPTAQMNSAFVSCPVFGVFSAMQQAHVLEIYRIAAERTREQLRPQRPFPPLFSLN